MASWTLVECLVDLRAEFNQAFPDRDRTSDGAIGDQAHAQESSDHNPDETGRTPYEDADNLNEVHAIDVDDDLNRPGVDMQACVDIVVGRHRDGRMAVLQNVIYNRRIWSRSWGWTAKPYTGPSPHTEHAHFSARYGSGPDGSNPENYSGVWGLLEAFDMLNLDDRTWLKGEIRAAVKEQLADVPHAVWAFDPGSADWAGVSDATYPAGGNGSVAPSTALESVLARVDAARADLADIKAALATLASGATSR